MQLDGDGVWLSWHDHTRSRGLARRLGVRMVVFDRFRTGFLRHFLGLFWTFERLVRIRPRVVYLQNSFLLLLACAIYKTVRRPGTTRIIVDCHNKSLKRALSGPLSSFFWRIKRWSFDRADVVIVSNSLLVPFAQRLCPNVACLRDPLPEWPRNATKFSFLPGLEGPYALVICSFEPDEPTDLLFEVAARVPNSLNLQLVITGDTRGIEVPSSVRDDPRIHVPGYVSFDTYQALLINAAVVVELTNDHDCLMCGAYEAMGAERPLVVSDTQLLREYFGAYAVLSTHDVGALVEAMRLALQIPQETLYRGRQEFSARFEQEWRTFLEAREGVAGVTDTRA